jgi:hypothetical protein
MAALEIISRFANASLYAECMSAGLECSLWRASLSVRGFETEGRSSGGCLTQSNNRVVSHVKNDGRCKAPCPLEQNGIRDA